MITKKKAAKFWAEYFSSTEKEAIKCNHMTIDCMVKFAQQQVKTLNIPIVIRQGKQLFCSMAGKGFCPYEYENGKCNVEGKCINHITK